MISARPDVSTTKLASTSPHTPRCRKFELINARFVYHKLKETARVSLCPCHHGLAARKETHESDWIPADRRPTRILEHNSLEEGLTLRSLAHTRGQDGNQQRSNKERIGHQSALPLVSNVTTEDSGRHDDTSSGAEDSPATSRTLVANALAVFCVLRV